MCQHVETPAIECIDDHLQQVHGLGVAHDAAAAQNGICAEKSAHTGKRQMTVPIDILISIKGHTRRSSRARLHISIPYFPAAAMVKTTKKRKKYR